MQITFDRRHLAIALLMALVPFKALAADQCTDRPECWPEGSSMQVGLQLVQRLNSLDKLLAAKHEELMKLVASSSSGGIKVDERLTVALRNQQAAWLKYRSTECELIGSLSGAGGTWPSTYANQCEVNHAELRLHRVRSAIHCIEKITVDKRLFDQNSCLQQLAPLTNK